MLFTSRAALVRASAIRVERSFTNARADGFRLFTCVARGAALRTTDLLATVFLVLMAMTQTLRSMIKVVAWGKS